MQSRLGSCREHQVTQRSTMPCWPSPWVVRPSHTLTVLGWAVRCPVSITVRTCSFLVPRAGDCESLHPNPGCGCYHREKGGAHQTAGSICWCLYQGKIIAASCLSPWSPLVSARQFLHHPETESAECISRTLPVCSHSSS